MKEQFVPYEIAKQLKDKGFNESCLFQYDISGALCDFRISKAGGYLNIAKNKIHNAPYATAPLWQQVIDWFREKHQLLITVLSASQESWHWHITTPHQQLTDNNALYNEYFSSYQEARQAAIEKALTLI